MTEEKKAIKPDSATVQPNADTPKSEFIELNGVAGDLIGEKDTKFFKLTNEKLIEKGNSYIVLGRDRPGGPLTGRGGVGEPNCSSIDIVVGRKSCVADNASLETKAWWSGPDFINDAARIHISQKTDIDDNFNLPNGTIGNSTKKIGNAELVRSGIGIKADSVRVIARSGIKLVSDCDSVNAQGLQDRERVGINLISGIPYEPGKDDINKRYGLKKYKHDMQPIPKGKNLEACLYEIANQLDAVSGVLTQFVTTQMKFNNWISMHNHNENFYGLPGTPSAPLCIQNNEANLEIFEKTIKGLGDFKMKYLTYFRSKYLVSKSNYYINSRYHHLN